MEQSLEKVLNDIVSAPETTACLFANKQGLCLCTKGKISSEMAGIGIAISEQACKLEPNLNPPTICMYSGNRRCIIQKDGEITGVLYKQSPN
ncbi:uncharacterized protein LOC129946564 [Eupeodes corollae]|uniref:uncharacterized protein LOC129946564 n=1 Tax=Eupeodes corollae TaxID=290404 RepID=UPI002491D2A4|nr:uncharacterized protein LOC129946564 [Eupeodes corollae]